MARISKFSPKNGRPFSQLKSVKYASIQPYCTTTLKCTKPKSTFHHFLQSSQQVFDSYIDCSMPHNYWTKIGNSSHSGVERIKTNLRQQCFCPNSYYDDISCVLISIAREPLGLRASQQLKGYQFISKNISYNYIVRAQSTKKLCLKNGVS